MSETIKVELSRDDALMLADACLNSMYHYRRMIADGAELGTAPKAAWVDHVKYWRDLYMRLFTAAMEPELPQGMKLPDISRATSNFPRRMTEASE